jgi:hypothetical protein
MPRFMNAFGLPKSGKELASIFSMVHRPLISDDISIFGSSPTRADLSPAASAAPSHCQSRGGPTV